MSQHPTQMYMQSRSLLRTRLIYPIASLGSALVCFEGKFKVRICKMDLITFLLKHDAIPTFAVSCDGTVLLILQVRVL